MWFFQSANNGIIKETEKPVVALSHLLMFFQTSKIPLLVLYSVTLTRNPFLRCLMAHTVTQASGDVAEVDILDLPEVSWSCCWCSSTSNRLGLRMMVKKYTILSWHWEWPRGNNSLPTVLSGWRRTRDQLLKDCPRFCNTQMEFFDNWIICNDHEIVHI